jgi:Sialic acid synthase
MDFNSGEDLLSLKESLHCEDSVCSPSISSVSFVEADEYARLHGLTVDSLFFDWTELIDNDPIIAPSVIELGPGELIEGPELEECEFRPIIPEPEQWNISIGSLKLLQQTCRECEERQIKEIFLAECLSTTLELASLKLEPPLLYSDHTLDCRRLARQVRNFMKDPLPDISLPLESYDVEQGQGLEFPRALVEADKEQTKSVENEKLNVTRDILWYISQTIKSDWTEENQQQLYESAAGYPGVGFSSRD